jgi:hypothetical protein
MEETTEPRSSMLEPPPDESDPDPHSIAEAGIWGPPAEPKADQAPLSSPGRPDAPPASPWWPTSTAPPPLASPTRPRGRLLAVSLATILVLGGGAAGIFLATRSSTQASAPPSDLPSSIQTTTPAAPTLPAAPASFAVQAKNGGKVDLSWDAVESDLGITGYTVLRDGETLQQLGPTETSYQDYDVVPKHTYSYALEAISPAGRSQQAILTVTTPKAPAASVGRVTGGFTIKGHFTDENFTNRDEGEKYSSFWIFSPVCQGDQACGVKTSGEGEGGKKLLVLKKGTYSGKVPIPKGGDCNSISLTETQTITFTVTDSAYIQGVWTATKISGTTRFDVPASFGCIAGFGVVSFTGTFAG